MNIAGKTEAEGRTGRRAFVVVGMHRSGTSAMTRTLSLLGAALPKGVMLAHEDNPSGFWEPQRITDLNDEILQALDSEWDDVFSFRPKQYLSNFDQYYVGRAVELLEEEFDGAELIVLKDPRISVLTTFWNRALEEAGFSTHYIIMVRNPLEVAESLRTRDFFPREKSLLLWSSYMIAVDRDTRAHSRTFVSFEQMLHDWHAVRDRIQLDTGMPFPRDTAAAAIEIDRFLDRGLRHHLSRPDDLYSRADVSEEVKALFRIFTGACEGAEVDEGTIEKIRAELEVIDAVVGPVVADLKSRARSLTKEIADLHTACGREIEHAKGLIEERDRLAAEVEAKSLAASELTNRIAALEAERDNLASEFEIRATQLAAERDGVVALADERQAEAARISKRLEAAEANAESVRAELRNLSRKHESILAERAKLEQKLKDVKAEAEKSDRRLQGEREKAEAEIQNARAAVSEGEEKLEERFNELATLTSLLREREEWAREQERQNEAAQQQLRWLAELEHQNRNQPRWWSLMPRSWHQTRARRMLKNAGVFDAEAYLEANPDVRAEGQDPLQHYLNHGMKENRRRG